MSVVQLPYEKPLSNTRVFCMISDTHISILDIIKFVKKIVGFVK